MEEAIELCRDHSGADLPGRLKIASVSSHLSNLSHHGHTLTSMLTRTPHSPSALHSPLSKTMAGGKRRSLIFEDNASASEIAIKETTEDLKKLFEEYKKYLERRVLPESAPTKPAYGKSSKDVELDSVFEEGKDKSVSKVVLRKDESSVRRHSEGVVRGKDVQPSVGVRGQIAALNQKSKDSEEIPPQSFGLSYSTSGFRGRSRTVDDDNLRRSPPLQHGKISMGNEDASRVRRHGLSREERTKKIEDIKKLFESNELLQLTASLAEGPTPWVPKSLTIPMLKPSDTSGNEEVRHNFSESSSIDKRSSVVLSPTITVSPPPGDIAGRTRLMTTPTVIRTVIKDRTPPPKQQVVTITHSNPPLDTAPSEVMATQPLREEAAVQKVTPQIKATETSETGKSAKVIQPTPQLPPAPTLSSTAHAQSKPPPVAASKKGRVSMGVLTGKVSSLREMFDSQSKSEDSYSSSSLRDSMRKKKTHSPKSSETTPTGSLSRRTRERDSCEPVLSPETIEDLSLSLSLSDTRSTSGMSQRLSHDEGGVSTLSGRTAASNIEADTSDETRNELSSSSHRETNDATPTTTQPPSGTSSQNPPSPPRPRLPSPSMFTPSPHETPPPRPPSPGYYYNLDESGTSFSEANDLDSESDLSCPSEPGSSLLDQSDLEWLEDQMLEWNEDRNLEEDEVDVGPVEPRPLKSLTSVLQELLITEGAYVRSLEVLSENYHPLLSSSPALPTFLHGTETTVLANVRELYQFQRSEVKN